MQTPNVGMYRLRDLADRISVYSSRRDIAMDLSRVVNRNRRLGFDGPADKGNPLTYTPATFRSVDCTEVYDFFGLIPIDATHQYYRRSRTVRDDITKLMAGAPVAPGVSSLSAFIAGGLTAAEPRLLPRRNEVACDPGRCAVTIGGRDIKRRLRHVGFDRTAF